MAAGVGPASQADGEEATAVDVICAADGCQQLGTKKCSRCSNEAYCSADCQRRAWPSHKLVCCRADSAESAIRELLRAGRLYSARARLKELPKPCKKLEAELEELISRGIDSEVIDGSMRLEAVGDMGRGYVAARDLQPGDFLLFDTAFLTAPTDGKEAPHFAMLAKLQRRLAGGARRQSAKVDAQADFFYDRVKALALKGNMDRAFLEQNTSLEADKREEMLVCSIVEGCALYCTEEPGHMALYAAASYFNHSCAPNAAIESSRSTLIVRATEAIPQGSEVLISYLPLQLLEEPVDRRRYRLQGGRGFDCHCVRCLAEAAAGSEGEEKAASGGDGQR